MPNVIIPIGDALAAKLQEKYGTLAALREATRQMWRLEVIEPELAAFLKQQAETTAQALEAAKAAKRAELEGTYN